MLSSVTGTSRVAYKISLFHEIRYMTTSGCPCSARCATFRWPSGHRVQPLWRPTCISPPPENSNSAPSAPLPTPVSSPVVTVASRLTGRARSCDSWPPAWRGPRRDRALPHVRCLVHRARPPERHPRCRRCPAPTSRGRRCRPLQALPTTVGRAVRLSPRHPLPMVRLHLWQSLVAMTGGY